MNTLAERVLQGDHQAVAQAISIVENDAPETAVMMKRLHPHTGHAQIIGITGVMGSGKSSLIAELATTYRKKGKSVGVIAVDPSSPFSGGALLGDRIRMMDLATDSGVFIRSMGTRGTLGGLTSSVYDVVEILDAAGFDIVLVETVGVGQDEVDIVKVADTIVVVLVPGLGDSIQTIKAGLMEIADIFVVNKKDRPGVEQIIAELESFLDLLGHEKHKPPIVQTNAKDHQGIDGLVDEITKHVAYAKQAHLFEQRRYARYEAELLEIIKKRLMRFIFDEQTLQTRMNEYITEILKKKVDPYAAAEELLGKILK